MERDDDLVRREEEAAAAAARGIGGDPGEPRYRNPAERAVREAGGGEQEGFEESLDALRDHAEHGDSGDAQFDAFTPERESDRSTAEYGEADEPEPRDL